MGLNELLPIRTVQALGAKLPQSPEKCLALVIEAFEENNYRWQSHRVIAEVAASRGMHYERSYRQMCWNNFRRPFLRLEDPRNTDELLRRELSPGSGFNDDPGGMLDLRGLSKAFGDSEEWNLNVKLTGGGDDLPEMSFGPSVPDAVTVNRSVRVMFESQVVSAWTMFETLAGDLCRQAIDQRPASLKLLSGDFDRISRLTRLPDKKQSNSNFASLRSIRQYYSRAFIVQAKRTQYTTTIESSSHLYRT
jgi:hypothetical protein